MSFGDSTGLSICHIHSPGITLLGSLWVWFFIYFRLFTHQTEHTVLLYHLHFSFLSFTFCPLKGEIFSEPLCLIGLSVPQESQDPWAHKVLLWGPFTGQCPGSESGSSALGRVTQSTTETPVPGHLTPLTAGTGGALEGLTLSPLWNNTINTIENYNRLRFQGC